MPKGLRIALRTFVAIMACLLFALSEIMLLSKLCLLNNERYANAVLDKDFYDSILKSRQKNLAELGSMVEISEDVLDEYASEQVCCDLAADYVRAVFSDMLRGSNDAGELSFSSPQLLAYMKSDFANYDFSETPYKTSDAAAEKAYAMICAQINDSVLFIPASVTNRLNKASGLLGVLDSVASFWVLPLLGGLALSAAVVLVRDTSSIRNNLFGAAAALWAATLGVFAFVLILYRESGKDVLEIDRDTLYQFLDGCIEAVRHLAFVISSLYFGVASALLAASGIYATARRKSHDKAPLIADDVA